MLNAYTIFWIIVHAMGDSHIHISLNFYEWIFFKLCFWVGGWVAVNHSVLFVSIWFHSIYFSSPHDVKHHFISLHSIQFHRIIRRSSGKYNAVHDANYFWKPIGYYVNIEVYIYDDKDTNKRIIGIRTQNSCSSRKFELNSLREKKIGSVIFVMQRRKPHSDLIRTTNDVELELFVFGIFEIRADIRSLDKHSINPPPKRIVGNKSP